MKVGDYIIQRYARNEANIWRVVGIYLGDVGQQSVVGLIPMNRKCPTDGTGEIEEMLTPIELVEPFLVETR